MQTTTVKTYPNVEAAIRASNTHIYVFNASDLLGKQPKGNIYVSLGADGDISVFLPPTWIPFDLMNYGTIEDIRASRSLRELQRSGLLVILTEESARTLIESPAYASERDRVMQESARLTKNRLNLENVSELELNIGGGPIVRDEVISKPNIAETSSYAATLMEEQRRAFMSGDNSALIQKITELFPKMSMTDFKAIETSDLQKSSILSMASSEAVMMVNNGKAIVVNDLPTIREKSLF